MNNTMAIIPPTELDPDRDAEVAKRVFRPYRARHLLLRWMEYFLERGLGLEHGANIFPLLHVVLYYAIFATLAFRWVTSPWLAVPLWVALVLLNYSLSIGILHMHAHRKLATWWLGNRILELLLCLPCMLSYPVMRYIHVYLHHRYSDGEGDPTSSKGFETGWRAVWYWLRYPFVCHRSAIAGLFARDAAPVWKRLRFQYVADTTIAIALMVAYGFFDLAGMLILYALPLVITSINIGFFAWLTHAPADDGPLNGSVNTTNNWMNLLIHNQGYHAVHHRHPSLHWTCLPDHLEMMSEVNDDLIVPYWVTIPSALRIVYPWAFRNAAHGKVWKERYQERVTRGHHRLAFLPYFGWIR